MAAYIPETLPIKSINHGSLVKLVGEANRALAGYDGLLQALPNPGLMLSPLTNQEAVLSSKIEGTQATIEEVLEYEAGAEQDEPTRQDIQEIQNYRTALLLGAEYIGGSDNRQITLWLLKALHDKLMTSVRGQDKTPGAFRTEQNWIGRPGTTIEQASFVPPSPLQLEDHLLAWEQYLGTDQEDALVQTAVVHAQFELLHPFKDGNGRIGRLLIPLFLYGKSIIQTPSFYLSAYLESNREEYYQRLQNISRNGEWADWVAFFLTAITEQAATNIARLRQIIALYDWSKIEVQRVSRSQHSAAIVDALFSRPVFRPADLAAATGMERSSIYPIVRKLEQQGIIEILSQGQGRRSTRYIFAELLNTVEGRKIV